MITNEVVNQAIDYIMNHINEEISIEEVAEYCHFSKFYFSRIFKEETGESIYAFIKRVKMEQSAFRLKVERERSVTDIGYEYGYSSSNYSTAFKQHLNLSPVDFRRQIVKHSVEHPFFHEEMNQLETFEECQKKITIETFDDIYALYERRKGNYHNLGMDWDEFLKRYEPYITKDTLMIERTFDDPSITDVDSCLYDIALSVDKSYPGENTCIIQGGKFAVYHFQGYAQQIYAVYQSIFNVWIPGSHSEIDERYGFDIYRSVDCDLMYMIIDLCIPIK